MKFLFILTAVLSLGLTSCEKEEIIPSTNTPQVNTIKIVADIEDGAPQGTEAPTYIDYTDIWGVQDLKMNFETNPLVYYDFVEVLNVDLSDTLQAFGQCGKQIPNPSAPSGYTFTPAIATWHIFINGQEVDSITGTTFNWDNL